MDIKKIRKTLGEGGVVIGTCIIECRNPQIGRIFSNFGFDFLVIDCEHSCYDLETVADMIIIAKLSGMAVIIKIGEYSYATFSKYLDAGADGFVLPRIRKKQEVEQVMEWTRFYPKGKRGYSAGAPFCNYGFDIDNKDDHRGFLKQKDSDLFIVVQFETAEAIENVDDILSVEGVDSAIMGLCDLSMSMGIAGDMSNKKLDVAVRKVFDACRANNIIIGNTAVNMETVKKQIDEGLQFIWWKTDHIFLQSSQGEVEEIRRHPKVK